MGDIKMSRRITFAVTSAASITVGAIIYVLFRPNSYIAIFVDNIVDFGIIRQILADGSNDFLKFYLPDFLWAFSLCFCLYSILDALKNGMIISSLITFFCSVTWEILQLLNFVSGTGDLIDIIMYLLAVICAASLTFKRRN